MNCYAKTTRGNVMKIYGLTSKPPTKEEILVLDTISDYLKQIKKEELAPSFIQDIICYYYADPIVYVLQEIARICGSIFAGVVSALIVYKILNEKDATKKTLEEIKKRSDLLQQNVNELKERLKHEKSPKVKKMAKDYINVAETIYINKKNSSKLIGIIIYQILKKRRVG